MNMLWKQHADFKSRWFALLFLLINCVCTAAPVLKLGSEENRQSGFSSLFQVPGTTETGEENHFTASACVNGLTHFSFRKQGGKQIYNTEGSVPRTSFCDTVFQQSHFSAADVLPTPGYYTFLFRYNLF
jgi:hypothetical protein